MRVCISLPVVGVFFVVGLRTDGGGDDCCNDGCDGGGRTCVVVGLFLSEFIDAVLTLPSI